MTETAIIGTPLDADDTEPDLVTLDDIEAAAVRIRGHAVRTPLLRSPWPDLWLKPESLQPIGAFKIRGAVNAVAHLDPVVRARGILAHSSGNHAQAVAYAARAFGVDAHIVIPDNASPRKIEATRALGGTVELVPLEQRFSRPEELARSTGKPMVPPYDHPDVVAGQGTIGLEIAQDAPDVAAVLVPVSGGGLLAGIAAAITALLPDAAVIGVEPELGGDAAESFRAGTRLGWAPQLTARTIADGLRTSSVGRLPWAHIRRQVADVITVTEDEIRAATAALTLRARLLAEPSGAVATAAHLFHPEQLPPGRRVAVISGGNIDPAVLAAILTDPAFADA
jgi:threonine dehydratase